MRKTYLRALIQVGTFSALAVVAACGGGGGAGGSDTGGGGSGGAGAGSGTGGAAGGGGSAGSGYAIEGTQIVRDGKPIELRGVNKMDHFSVNVDLGDAAAAHVEVVREPIDMSVTPDDRLDTIVQAARTKGIVTMLAGFTYDCNLGNPSLPGGGTNYPECQLLNTNPSPAGEPDADPRYEAVMARWKQIAQKYAGQSDVWLDPWNEPYAWDCSKSFSGERWASDMRAIVKTIRDTGASNIIVVPLPLCDQEGTLMAKGAEVLAGNQNLVFAIHAYDLWIFDQDTQAVEDYYGTPASRFQKLLDAGLPFLVTEYGAGTNTQAPRSVERFLNDAREKKVSTLAWIWKWNDGGDLNAIFTAEGQPHDNDNKGYGSLVLKYLAEPH